MKTFIISLAAVEIDYLDLKTESNPIIIRPLQRFPNIAPVCSEGDVVKRSLHGRLQYQMFPVHRRLAPSAKGLELRINILRRCTAILKPRCV